VPLVALARPHLAAGELPRRREGMVVKSRGICEIQRIRKSLENRRNFRKLQDQFYWIRGEEYYNFCYYNMV
jgi:hypothetical protein